jgi:hypothetical protein
MADPATVVIGILTAFQTMKSYLSTMQGNIQALKDLMKEVFLYEQLIMEQQTSLRSCTQLTDAHADAIRNFYDGIKGMESILKDCASEQEKKGLFKRAYSFCVDWCSAPDNAKKIREYSEKISNAAQLLGMSVITRVEQKADFLILQGKALQSSLDAAIAKLNETKNPEEFAREVSRLLEMDIGEIKEDLKMNHKELSDQMSQIHRDLEELKLALNDRPKPTSLPDIKSEDARLFWERCFGTSAKVTSNEMKTVRGLPAFSASSLKERECIERERGNALKERERTHSARRALTLARQALQNRFPSIQGDQVAALIKYMSAIDGDDAEVPSLKERERMH